MRGRIAFFLVRFATFSNLNIKKMSCLESRISISEELECVVLFFGALQNRYAEETGDTRTRNSEVLLGGTGLAPSS
jgi:hypothetical protein